MVTSGWIHHIESVHTFNDGGLLYRFTTISNNKITASVAGNRYKTKDCVDSGRNRQSRTSSPGDETICSNDEDDDENVPRLMCQRGVVRSNCIDCLDRTNVAQWCIGVRVLACQLYVLGVDLCVVRPNGMSKGIGIMQSGGVSTTSTCQRTSRAEIVLTPASQITAVITQMWEMLGDRIALQYGGSEAHKKVTGQTISKGASSKKTEGKKTSEVLTSIRRYYSNTFTDRS